MQNNNESHVFNTLFRFDFHTIKKMIKDTDNDELS